MNLATTVLFVITTIHLAFAAVSNNIQQTVGACSIADINLIPGAVGNIYSVNENLGELSSSTAYYQGQYSTEIRIGSFTNSGSINFRVGGDYSTLYGVPLDTAQFLLEETGYLKALSTGIYEFQLTDVDDGVLVAIGNSAYDCCSGIPGSAAPFLFEIKAANDDSNPVFKSWIYLEEGFVYPFKLVFLNALSAGSLSLKVKTPEGIVTDVGEYLFQSNGNAIDCDPTVISSNYPRLTSFIFSNDYNQVGHGSSVITTDGSTMLLDLITYGNLGTTSYTTIRYDDTTTSYSTATVYTSKDYGAVYKSVFVFAPQFTTVYYYNQPPGSYSTNTVTSENLVTVYGPRMSTSVTVGLEPTTQYTTFMKDGEETTEAIVVAPTILTVVAYPNPPKKGTVTTEINGTWKVYRYKSATHTTFTTNVMSKDYTISTETIIADDKTTRKIWIFHWEPLETSMATSFYQGTTTSTFSTFIASTTVDDKPLGYWSNIIYLPAYSTSFVLGNLENTVTITKDATTYAQVQLTSFATITTWTTENARSTGFIPVTFGTTTSWAYAYIYPSPTETYVEYPETTTSISTKWLYNAEQETIGWEVFNYVPSFSISYSFWDNEDFKTIYQTSTFSSDDQHHGVTIIRIIERPPMQTFTSFWTGTRLTTSFQQTESRGNANIPVTDTVAIVYNPLPTVEVSDCSGSILTVQCSASTDIVTVGGESDTITFTSCEWPTYLSGSFESSIITTTILHNEDSLLYTITNVNNPVITCQTATTVTDCDGEVQDAKCYYGNSNTVVGTNTIVLLTTSCELPEGVSGSFATSETSPVITLDGKITYVVATNTVIPQVTCEVRNVALQVGDCTNSMHLVNCDVITTHVYVDYATITAWTTSCDVPQELPAVVAEAITTSTVTLDGAETVLTLTNTNSFIVTCPAMETSLVLNDCYNEPFTATCEVATSVITIDDVTGFAWTTSCDLPQNVGGLFLPVTTTTTIEIGFMNTEVTLTNTNSPVIICESTSITTILNDCSNKPVTATCEIATTSVAGVYTAWTTSCSPPADAPLSYDTSLTTLLVPIDDTTSTVTLTQTVIPIFTCEPVTVDLSIIDCNNSEYIATCTVATTAITINADSYFAWTTSCAFPVDLTGSFDTTIEVSTFADDLFTATHVNVPHVECAPTTITTLVSACSATIKATCEVATTVVEEQEMKATYWTTSCENADSVSFVSAVVTKVLSSGDIALTVTLVNTDKAMSSCLIISSPTSSTKSSAIASSTSSAIAGTASLTSSAIASSTATKSSTSSAIASFIPASSSLTSSTVTVSNSASSYVSMSAALSVLPSVPSTASSVLPSTLTSGSLAPISTALVTRSALSSLLSPSVPKSKSESESESESELSSSVSAVPLTFTTTVTNNVCETKTSTISAVLGNATIELVAIAVPPRSCYESTLTRTVANSFCALETHTQRHTTAAAGVPIMVYTEVVATPPESCNMYYTWEPATDCFEEAVTVTSFIGTTNGVGAYVNATLVIIETIDTGICGGPSTSGAVDPFSGIKVPPTVVHTLAVTSGAAVSGVPVVTDAVSGKSADTVLTETGTAAGPATRGTLPRVLPTDTLPTDTLPTGTVSISAPTYDGKGARQGTSILAFIVLFLTNFL